MVRARPFHAVTQQKAGLKVPPIISAHTRIYTMEKNKHMQLA
jgi:hypothetical protein